MNPLLRHPALGILKKALLRECKLQLFTLFLLIIISSALTVFTFKESVIFPTIGLLGLIISIHFMYQTAGLLNAEKHRLIWLLKNQPYAIVWVYYVKTDQLPFGFHLSSATTLYFKLSDGDEITVGVSKKEFKIISRYLNRLLPHATFGYSRDRAQWYHVHPDMLRKKKEK